ncbi:hypothetical protein FFK22_008985 [Mycobacterium sp. KBS0706]|uniref:hypothetical protein n=1 Tax=Mycobacterium sp. KBS0706 TaxID=2578109 RepID=UPI00110F7FB3|nr:hypothetical protein [Mycobacterium sp. KBS0706]TSD89104.1 hypothetical protein FFK22_008985 [Mycobacterium sp. KBS0706]
MGTIPDPLATMRDLFEQISAMTAPGDVLGARGRPVKKLRAIRITADAGAELARQMLDIKHGKVTL